jgi:DNA excision repair protein ERCC-2
MALTLSKLFMRTISQNPNENQTGVSLWTLEDVERFQAKKRLEIEKELAAETVVKEKRQEEMDEEEDYWNGGISDGMLGEFTLDV